MLLSIVFSFRNEIEVLPELLRRTRAALRSLDGIAYELIFVNDASTDGSDRLLRDEADREGDIVLLTTSRNFGVTACALAGIRRAAGDAVVYLDADLQDPPELIPDLVAAWRDGADVVHTIRRSRSGEHPLKLLVTRIGYRILARLSNITLIENAGDFKLLSRRAVDHLAAMGEQRPYLRGLVSWIGFRQATVPYDRQRRFGGATKYPVYGWRVLDNFFSSALISFTDVPLKLAIAAGFVISAGAFLYLVAVIVMKLLGWNLPGWSAIMATMLVLGGIQLFAIGIIGLYINAIYLQVLQRPTCIIEDAYAPGRAGDADSRA